MKNLFVLLFFLLIQIEAISQTLIRRDDMEQPSTWRGTSTTGTNSSFIGGFSSLADNPPNYPQFSSNDSCYRILGIGLGGSPVERDTFIYPNTFVTSGKQYQIRFKLASFGLSPATQTAAGVDQTDWIEFQYTLNNGLSWWRDAQIQGISNSMWSFDGAIGTNTKLSVVRTGSVSTTTPTIYVSNAGNPIVNVSVNVPFTNLTQIRIRFVTNINAIGETFMLDDVEIWDMTVPLPIELLGFKGFCKDGNVELSWITGSEENNDFFSIFSSSDGTNFDMIGKVDGSGNSNFPLEYQFEDNNKFSGIRYYKLCQTDYDGTQECFDPIAVFCSSMPDNELRGIFNFLGQEVDKNYTGIKLYMYLNGTVKKTSH